MVDCLQRAEDFATDSLVALADALAVGIDVIAQSLRKVLPSRPGETLYVGRFGERYLWPYRNSGCGGIPIADQSPMLRTLHRSEARFSSIGLEALDMVAANIVRSNVMGRQEAEEGRQHVFGITILDLPQQRPVARIHGRLPPRIRLLSVEPEERRLRIGSVIGEGLGLHPKPSRMKIPHRRADRRDPGGDERRRPINVPCHLAKRAAPMALLFRQEVFSLLDCRHGVGEGGLADQRSSDLSRVAHQVHSGSPQVSC